MGKKRERKVEKIQLEGELIQMKDHTRKIK